MQHHLKKFLPLSLMLALLSYGCAQDNVATTEAAKPVAVAAQKQEAKPYVGNLLLMSKKAKTLSVEMGKGEQAKTVTVKFDDKTKGMEHAVQGHAIIVTYEDRNGEQFATEVKAKLAELPAGVTEIKTAELKDLLDKKSAITLVDSRPAGRYAQDHLPEAINIEVEVLAEKKEAVLPKEKDKLLVFYCGGPT